MIEVVLATSGIAAVVLGTWRGYACAREALAPLVHEGDATRSLIEAAQPLHTRPRVRLFVRRAATSVGWLGIALYGLYLTSVGLAVAR